MGIMQTIFGNNQAPKAAEPVQPGVNAPSQVGAPNNPHLPVPTPGAAATSATSATSEPSPLADFEKLWDNGTTNTGDAPAPLFDLDHAKLNEAMKNADFTKTVPPEILQKALSGDSAALQAALNSVARTAFSHQTMATTKLIEQALARRDKELAEKMPEMVRSSRINENLADSPLFQHEATRPLLESLKNQLQQKYPQATAAQIAEQAKKYIQEFATLAAGKPANQAAAVNPNEDWEKFEL